MVKVNLQASEEVFMKEIGLKDNLKDMVL